MPFQHTMAAVERYGLLPGALPHLLKPLLCPLSCCKLRCSLLIRHLLTPSGLQITCKQFVGK